VDFVGVDEGDPIAGVFGGVDAHADVAGGGEAFEWGSVHNEAAVAAEGAAFQCRLVGRWALRVVVNDKGLGGAGDRREERSEERLFPRAEDQMRGDLRGHGGWLRASAVFLRYMKGNRDVIEQLNKMLYNELTAINQYFLHARMHRNWGFYRLGETIYKESLGEMRHADWLIERILFLDGLPNLQNLGKLHIGEDGVEALECDLTLEMVARDDTATAIALFEKTEDYVSRDIATRILVDSEEHVDFLETQLALVKSIGRENYLQSAMGEIPEPS
jgi:bacterioferritin